MTATSFAPLTTTAQDALAPGSVATNAAGEPVLVRQSPGYDAAGAGEVAAGGQVTVADYAVTAADGSLWYPVAGGYVPASALAAGAAPVADTAAAPVAETAAAPAPIAGYYDANGVWVEEAVATDAAAAPVSGYYDANGVWIEDGVAAAPVAEPVTGSGSGYYDQNGVWVDTSGATTTEAAAPAESTTGYYDQNGVWVDTSGAATTEAAAPVTTDASQPAAAPGTGYYDQNGVWVDTSGAATDSAAAPTGTGYYDQNGVWVDTTAAAADSAVQYNDASGVSNTTATAVPVGTAYIAGTNGDGAICRSGADWAAGEIATVGEGSTIEVTGGAVGEWVPVNCNGVGGYVNSSFISWDQPVATTAQESDTRQRRRNRDRGNDVSGGATGVSGQPLVDFAMSYLGSPYVYAGAGPSGFDCSGFTMFVVQNTLGMDIGHGVPGQYGAGTPVSQGQLAPGDLVFFQGTNGPGISHVGIYIGNGQFIHAENESTGVVISDLNSGYYSSHYYGAVRLG